MLKKWKSWTTILWKNALLKQCCIWLRLTHSVLSPINRLSLLWTVCVKTSMRKIYNTWRSLLKRSLSIKKSSHSHLKIRLMGWTCVRLLKWLLNLRTLLRKLSTMTQVMLKMKALIMVLTLLNGCNSVNQKLSPLKVFGTVD